MNSSIEQLENDTVSILEEKMNKDHQFRMTYTSISEFYTKKIMSFISKDSMQPLAEEYENVIQAQYFKGYHVMRLLLEDEYFTEEKDIWHWLEGEASIKIPSLLEEALKYLDNKDWYYTDRAYAFSLKLLREIDVAYEAFKVSRKEIAYLGAIQAFLDDPRHKGWDLPSVEFMSHFGRLDDAVFLNPEIYMTISHFEEGKEIWNLQAWGPHNNDEWMGNVEFHHFSTQDGMLYVMNVMLSELIREDERYSIIGTLYDKLPEHIQTALQIKNYTCRDMETLHK